MNCRELVALVTDYFEGTLSDHDRLVFEAHIATCDGCQMHLEQMRKTIGLLGSIQERDLSEEAKTDLLAAFRPWKTEPAVTTPSGSGLFDSLRRLLKR